MHGPCLGLVYLTKCSATSAQYDRVILPTLNKYNLYKTCSKNDKSSQIKIDLIEESPFHLKGSFPGPQGTPYEGGHFEVVRC